MGRKFYDDFVREPLDKMAQSIVDMTYGYQSTVVPKKHYKEILEKDLIELASHESNIELALLRPYYDMISSMNKENRKYFVKALLMNELKIKYSSLDAKGAFALASTWDFIEDNNMKSILDKEIIDVYDSIVKNKGNTRKESDIN